MTKQSTSGPLISQELRFKGYEREFFKKILLSVIVFSALALLSALAVQALLQPNRFSGDFKLDAQTLGNFFVFTFATSVAFAGAWVVIQIASKQEELSKNQFKLVQDQKQLAEDQLELTKKTAPDYGFAQAAGSSAALGLQVFTQKVTVLFAFYFKARSGNSNDLNKETFQTQSAMVVKNLIDLLQEPWVVELSEYEGDTLSAQAENDPKKMVLLTNALILELSNLKTILESPNFSNEAIRSEAALKILSSLFEGVQVFFSQLRGIRETYEGKILSNVLTRFNSDLPRGPASVHEKLLKMELKPNFSVL
jgi:hypothetical protein